MIFPDILYPSYLWLEPERDEELLLDLLVPLVLLDLLVPLFEFPDLDDADEPDLDDEEEPDLDDEPEL